MPHPASLSAMSYGAFLVTPRSFISLTFGMTRHFSPAWFAVNMGTGVIGALFHSFPYGGESRVMNGFALAFFFLNIILFIIFLVLSTACYIMFPRIWGSMLHHPVQSLYLGCFPMGADTLITVGIVVVSQYWGFGGTTFVYVLWGFWWLDAVLSFLCCFGLIYIMYVVLLPIYLMHLSTDIVSQGYAPCPFHVYSHTAVASPRRHAHCMLLNRPAPSRIVDKYTSPPCVCNNGRVNHHGIHWNIPGLDDPNGIHASYPYRWPTRSRHDHLFIPPPRTMRTGRVLPPPRRSELQNDDSYGCRHRIGRRTRGEDTQRVLFLRRLFTVVHGGVLVAHGVHRRRRRAFART